MDSFTLRRKIAVLLLAASLLASAASAADLRGVTPPQALQLLSRLAAFLDSFWEKAGASLDPWGGDQEGASLDPDGREENSGSLDPDGGRKAGGSLDPNGACFTSDCSSAQAQPPSVAGTGAIGEPLPGATGGF